VIGRGVLEDWRTGVFARRKSIPKVEVFSPGSSRHSMVKTEVSLDGLLTSATPELLQLLNSWRPSSL
jgi:hypothetical protein